MTGAAPGSPGEIRVEQRRPEHDAELFALYADIFGKKNAEASRVRWRWQYLDNPLTRDSGPVIWMARDGDRLIGQMATMPFETWWGDREVRGSAGMDYFVRRDAQGRGLGILLSETWAAHIGIAFAMGLTPSSYPLFRKIFKDVGPVPFFQKIVDPLAISKKRFGAALGTLAMPALAAGLRLKFGVEPEIGLDWSVGPVTDFTDEYDQLWDRARSSYLMCVAKRREYLRWKYLACPQRTYDVLEARFDGELRGFAVTRLGEHKGLRLGYLIDLFADADGRDAKAALLRTALDRFRAAGVARAQAWTTNRALQEDLRRFGFFPGQSSVQFCIKWTEDPHGAFDDLGRWQWMLGDGDLDR